MLFQMYRKKGKKTELIFIALPYYTCTNKTYFLKDGALLMNNSMFNDYPDLVNFNQMRKMLGNIGPTLAYKLLRNGTIKSIKVGRAYRISKINIINYLMQNH